MAPSAPGKDDGYVPEHIKGILPYVESHYRPRPNREGRAIAGLSMGGFVAVFTGLHQLDTFSEVHSFRGGLASLSKYGFLSFWVLHSGEHDIANLRCALHRTAQIMFP
jgi:S-formylglutathione hydrolase FrmB